MNPMAASAISRIGISSPVRKPVETIIIRLNLACCQRILFRDPFRSMTLRACSQSNSFFIDRRVGIDLRFDSVNPMAGGTGRGIGPAPGGENSMDALRKLLGDRRMTGTTSLRNIGSKDR